MTFTIDQVYKSGVPRGQPLLELANTFTSGDSGDKTVSPTTNPAWNYLVSEVRMWGSPVTSGTGVGLMKIQHPDYKGIETSIQTFGSFGQVTKTPIEVSSVTYYVHQFEPPILLKANASVSTLTVGLPENVALDSGEFYTLFSGWKIKQTDYE